MWLHFCLWRKYALCMNPHGKERTWKACRWISLVFAYCVFLPHWAGYVFFENFAFDVVHECAWGSRGSFIPARYNSSRAKCIKCGYCSMYFSPNKFIFHSHRTPDAKYTQPDAANFNSWRRHLKLSDKSATDELSHAWEDVKAMFNGGTRKRTFSLQGGGGGGKKMQKLGLREYRRILEGEKRQTFQRVRDTHTVLM